MTNNENENDIDIDAQEDFEKEPKQQRASLKDTWDSNPMLKIAAVILGIALLAGGYFAFFAAPPEQQVSTVDKGQKADTTVGKETNDPTYNKKIEEQNKKNAQEAMKTGGSTVPVPVGAPEKGDLTLPATPPPPTVDPLAEWRQKTEAKRVQMENEQAPEEKEPEQPEVVPLVQPIHPQPTMKMDPNAAKLLQEQMRTIISSQAPGTSVTKTVTQNTSLYAKKLAKERLEAGQKSAAGTSAPGAAGSGASALSGGAQAVAPKKTIVTAGSIAYAQLINDLNSDITGPVLAQMLSGPFEGGRAIGSFQKDIIGEDGYMTLTFKTIVKDGVSYKVQATALDENTTLTGLESDVDHHYFARFILPGIADFIKGYSTALGTVGTATTTTAGGGVASSTPPPTPHQAAMQGFQDLATQVAQQVQQDGNIPITVLLSHGTTMGLLFTSPVTTADVDK